MRENTIPVWVFFQEYLKKVATKKVLDIKLELLDYVIGKQCRIP
jgi:hypothetical protein